MKASRAARKTRPVSARDILELFVLAPGSAQEQAPILPSLPHPPAPQPPPPRGGGAGGGGEAGGGWQRIIRVHERTLRALDGRGGDLPAGRELRALGRDLFEALFPGDARRLYDLAPPPQPARLLDVVFPSMIDWVSDKPWELAYDPGRREFLATTSVNFVRNVF